jgi:hypothetical protein
LSQNTHSCIEDDIIRIKDSSGNSIALVEYDVTLCLSTPFKKGKYQTQEPTFLTSKEWQSDQMIFSYWHSEKQVKMFCTSFKQSCHVFYNSLNFQAICQNYLFHRYSGTWPSPPSVFQTMNIFYRTLQLLFSVNW